MSSKFVHVERLWGTIQRRHLSRICMSCQRLRRSIDNLLLAWFSTPMRIHPVGLCNIMHHSNIPWWDAATPWSTDDIVHVLLPHLCLRLYVAPIHSNHLCLGTSIPRSRFDVGPLDRGTIFPPPRIGNCEDNIV